MRVIWENLRSTSSNNQHPHPHFNPLYISSSYEVIGSFCWYQASGGASNDVYIYINIHTYIIYRYVINTFIYISLFVSGGLIKRIFFSIFLLPEIFNIFMVHLISPKQQPWPWPWCHGARRRRCIQPAQCDGRSGLRGAFACCWRRQRARRRRTTHAGRWDVVFKDTPGKAWMMMRSGMYIQWGMVLMNIDDCVKFSWISMIVLNSDGCRL